MKRKIKVVNVVGTRPNFMKVAPLLWQFKRRKEVFEPVLLHTGQHNDRGMSEVFFDELKVAAPEIYLGISGGTHAEQTGRILIETEKVLLQETPACVVVTGDVNSSLAAALAAAKLQIPVAHVEAGLRSFNRRMPEEINRIVIDHLSQFLFVHEVSAQTNLQRENINWESIYFVGNVMVDSLLWALRNAVKSSKILDQLRLKPKSYGIVTLHRPENVDDSLILKNLWETISYIAQEIRLVWPMHPRTRRRLSEFGLDTAVANTNGLVVLEPLGYIDFITIMASSRFVLTDSGGIQEESTVLGVPCLTVRDETERPITIQQGTNTIVGTQRDQIVNVVSGILNGQGKGGRIPELWDGRAAERIVEILERELR